MSKKLFTPVGTQCKVHTSVYGLCFGNPIFPWLCLTLREVKSLVYNQTWGFVSEWSINVVKSLRIRYVYLIYSMPVIFVYLLLLDRLLLLKKWGKTIRGLRLTRFIPPYWCTLLCASFHLLACDLPMSMGSCLAPMVFPPKLQLRLPPT